MESEGESEETRLASRRGFLYIRTLRSGGQTAVEPKMARSQKMPIIVMLNPAEITGFRLCSDFGISVHYGTIKIHVRHSF